MPGCACDILIKTIFSYIPPKKEGAEMTLQSQVRVLQIEINQVHAVVSKLDPSHCGSILLALNTGTDPAMYAGGKALKPLLTTRGTLRKRLIGELRRQLTEKVCLPQPAGF
ncbi:hypothetical protein A2976_00545 [candidate division WWE3 bacterium RIFCSPLOWO2_01_FULL_41_9]|uniref:Uncharacterized protein n=3 Tax=Katanobacteria TaxID=422282 RepID=A0A1F4VIC5_UNCKA|nr:MAG: hypothetical protein A2976_00545 [candidate division WWE3 bacterium RIFCSPLOWO2_01_FULL_41_9]